MVAPMASATLAIGALLDLVSATLCFVAARMVLRRLPADRGLSTEAFALFWFGVGVVNLLQAGLAAVALARDPGVVLATAVWNTRIVLALTSFAGLVYYLSYVYTGRTWARAPIILFYAMTFLLMETWMGLADPVAAATTGWRVDLTFANEARTLLYAVVVLCFFVPPLAAAIAYGLTLRFVRDPAARRRARLMTIGLAIYFAGLTAGYLASWSWWGLVENLLGIAAAGVAILALRDAKRESRGEGIDARLADRVRVLV